MKEAARLGVTPIKLALFSFGLISKPQVEICMRPCNAPWNVWNQNKTADLLELFRQSGGLSMVIQKLRCAPKRTVPFC